jgi:hypothetical protein
MRQDSSLEMNLKASQHNTFKVGITKLYMNVISIENSSNSFDIFLEKCCCARSPFEDLLPFANSVTHWTLYGYEGRVHKF